MSGSNFSSCEQPYDHKDCRRFIPDKMTTVRGIKLPKTWFNVANMANRQPYDGTVGSNFYLLNKVFFEFSDNKIYIKAN